MVKRHLACRKIKSRNIVNMEIRKRRWKQTIWCLLPGNPDGNTKSLITLGSQDNSMPEISRSWDLVVVGTCSSRNIFISESLSMTYLSRAIDRTVTIQVTCKDKVLSTYTNVGSNYMWNYQSFNKYEAIILISNGALSSTAYHVYIVDPPLTIHSWLHTQTTNVARNHKTTLYYQRNLVKGK